MFEDFFNNLVSSVSDIAAQTQQNLVLLLSVLGLLFSIYIINYFLKGRLFYLGLVPRKLKGIPGIVFSPFLHANFNHVFFNSIPLFVLLDFVCIFSPDHWLLITITITLMSGFLTWLFASKGTHVGASGVITGYWGYLVFNIYAQTSIMSIILGAISLYYFAGIFLGIFPKERGVSWEGHLFGLMAGILAAWQINLLVQYFN